MLKGILASFIFHTCFESCVVSFVDVSEGCFMVSITLFDDSIVVLVVMIAW